MASINNISGVARVRNTLIPECGPGELIMWRLLRGSGIATTAIISNGTNSSPKPLSHNDDTI
jgi:hypothetical protein